MSNLTPKIIPFEEPFKAAISHIRLQVFVEEQGIDKDLDFDGLDKFATQVLVSNETGKFIATARMLDNGHIGRIAVLNNHRLQGAGSCALNTLISFAKNNEYRRVYLGSQLHAKKFYIKKGFKICSEVFMDAGIEHIEMELLLES